MKSVLFFMMKSILFLDLKIGILHVKQYILCAIQKYLYAEFTLNEKKQSKPWIVSLVIVGVKDNYMHYKVFKETM